MEPLKITLVENRNGCRHIKWTGVLGTAGVLTTIAAPIAAFAAWFMGPSVIVLISAVLFVLLVSMVRRCYSSPLEDLPIGA